MIVVVLQKQFFGATELPPTSSVKLFGSQSEDFTNELNLAKHIPFRQPPHLAFPDHVHDLVSLDRPAGRVKGSEPLAGVDPSFDRPMILFHYVVQVRTGTTATAPAELSLRL